MHLIARLKRRMGRLNGRVPCGHRHALRPATDGGGGLRRRERGQLVHIGRCVGLGGAAIVGCKWVRREMGHINKETKS